MFTLRLANGEIADTPSNAHHSAGIGEMVGSTTSPAAQCEQILILILWTDIVAVKVKGKGTYT